MKKQDRGPAAPGAHCAECAALRTHLHAMVDLADWHVNEIEGIAESTRDPADIARAKRVRALFNAADQAIDPTTRSASASEPPAEEKT